jgi:hypothetical protein
MKTKQQSLLDFLRSLGYNKFYVDARQNGYRIKVRRYKNFVTPAQTKDNIPEIIKFSEKVTYAAVENRPIPGYNMSTNFLIIRTSERPSLIKR